jgi:hypothetical protein
MLTMVLLSHAGDCAAMVTWSGCDIDAESCWQQCYQAMLAMVMPSRLSHDPM